MSSRPSSSWSANQSQPTWSGPSALVLHSRSIQGEPLDRKRAPTGVSPRRRPGIRVSE